MYRCVKMTARMPAKKPLMWSQHDCATPFRSLPGAAFCRFGSSAAAASETDASLASSAKAEVLSFADALAAAMSTWNEVKN
jgi:hypothetical protein